MDAKPPAVLLSLLGLMLVWPSALSDRGPREHTAGSVSAYNESGEQRPRVEMSSMVSCDADKQHYCFNYGQCMVLVDLNRTLCKCERGYSGPRCGDIQLVFQPMREEQLVQVVVSVVMLLIGLSGTFYFFYKWYRKNKAPHPQKRQGCVGMSSA